MSTYLRNEENTPVQRANTSPLTFAELVEQLQKQTTPPDIDQISSWLAAANISRADLEPYLGFKEGNYWRHRVCRNESVEMLVICWRPGQKNFLRNGSSR